MIPERTVFAFFPYLITHNRVPLRGIEFRSNTDLDDLPADAKKHLEILSQMFFLQDGVRIEQMTCACLEFPADKADQIEFRRRLHEAQLLIGYLYCSPHPSGGVLLPAEKSTLFVFRLGDTFGSPGMVPTSLVWHDQHGSNRVKRIDGKDTPSTDMTQGYSGTRNQTTPLWVAEGSRLFPELPHITLNETQELSIHIDMLLSRPYHWALEYLYHPPEDYPPDLRNRVFVSLEWYLKSCRASITEAEVVVHLAIALESLVRVRPGEGVTERFKDAIQTLLGPVPRLDDWLD